MRLKLLTVLLLNFCFLTQAVGQDKPVRVIPVPSAASEELQAALRNWPVPQVSELPDPPGSAAEWKAAIEQADNQRSAVVPQLLEQTGVQLTRGTIDGVNIHRLVPSRIEPENSNRLVLYVHGGAYVYGNGDAGIFEAILIADRVGIPVLSVDYRMPPDHPFPAAVDDIVSVYKQLLESRSPQTIIFGGTSAGGGLALAALHQLRTLELPFPGAIYAGTPWADLTKTGDTLYTNETLDRILVTYDGRLSAAAELYAGEADLKNPLISPVYGDFVGFPPTMLTTGTRDLFLSDVARTHRKLRQSGAIADLHVYEGMSHAGYLVSPETPESKNMYEELRYFISQHLD
jgi:monoterpene epsilon-lactone hydrolase